MRILLGILALAMTASAATIKQTEPIHFDASKEDNGKHPFVIDLQGSDPKTCPEGWDMYVRHVMPTVKDAPKAPEGDYHSLLYVTPGQMVVSRPSDPFAIFCIKVD